MSRKSARPYSVRRRLIAAVLGASILIWTACTGIVVYVSWQETSDVFDDALKESARLVTVLGASLKKQGALAAADQLYEPEPVKLRLYYQIIDDQGRVLRKARNAPSQPFSSDLGKRKGFSDVWLDGKAWRVYSLRAPDQNFQVQVAQPWDKRIDLLKDVSETLIWPALGLLMLLTAACWWSIKRILRPIEETAARIATKSPDDLAPIPAEHEPRELQPVLRSFNLVLSRLDRALSLERSFTADAAHQLRTPLAALRMRIQLLQRRHADQADATEQDALDLQTLRNDVDRCTSLVESLLLLARLDPERPELMPREMVDLKALLESLAGDFPQLPQDALRIDCAVAAIEAHAALLHSALRNLVDNALRYGPSQGPVFISAQRQGERVRIMVRDEGPGVPEQERARLGERFFRVLGTGKSGNGLGLAIVSRIVLLHGGRVAYEPGLNGRGLTVVLDIQAA